ncbi:phosphatidylglycerol lysyltransferase domain-containing protein [Methylotuvimicrobium sp.]|uniref:phosphatidylglycerol lysyltransferase domain-containing protein n=1 Tax=Methylotuvimicrobium sp. TaxID=2822413 RepID=UPI003D65906F
MTKPLLTTVDLVRQYGGPVSHAALDPLRSTFRTPGIDGLISFLLVRRCAVVFGDPICATEDKPRLTGAFASYCAGKGWSILFVAVTADLQVYARDRGYASMEFASLLMTDPQNDPEAGPQGRHLRQHLNHTRRTGVTVREHQGEIDAQMEAQTQAACDAWLDDRRGPQMYLGRPRLFDDKVGRRWFLGEQAGKVVGFLSMLWVGGLESQYLINIGFSAPNAPLHTNELMIVTALQALREEGVDSVCLGVGPLEALGRIEGCGAIVEFLSRRLYRLAAKLMHQHGKTVFWEKFGITKREPLYLIFQSSRLRPTELYALLRAFNFSVTG